MKMTAEVRSTTDRAGGGGGAAAAAGGRAAAWTSVSWVTVQGSSSGLPRASRAEEEGLEGLVHSI